MIESYKKNLFKELFLKFLKTKEMRLGKTIKAIIIKIDKNNIWLDTGLKSEAIVLKDIFKTENEKKSLQIGNCIDVSLEDIDNNLGETIISIEKVRKKEHWVTLELTYNSKNNIKGTVISTTRGGYIIDLLGFKGFLPGSLIDIKPVINFVSLLGKQLEFKIIKLDTKRNSIIVSRKAVLEEEKIQGKKNLLQTISINNILLGLVKNITDFGVFIDLGGIDGLLHITDMSWGRIKHPNELVQIGDEITVKIIKIDLVTKRISLGVKQLSEDPWLNIKKKFKIGTKIKGTITNITEYGCFIKLQEGIEGLVHISEMNWISKSMNPIDKNMIGQKIDVMILEINIIKHRISLGMKQCMINPWNNFLAQYKIGSKITTTIKNITEFGLFVSIDTRINGLVHISDITWFDINNCIKLLKKETTIETIILAIDTEKERISLGIKQLTPDPFFVFIRKHTLTQKLIGNIYNIKKTKIEINFFHEIKGELHINEEIANNININKKIICQINKFNLLKRNLNIHVVK